jgi:phosphatidylglycerol lysyltransferase
VGWVGTERRSLKWGLRELPLPGARSTVAQLAIGLADMTFGAAALYLLLPTSANIGFPIFVGVFAIAMTLGLLSHVPGGIGVFETVMLIVIPGAPTTEVLASLLVFRCVYYLLPLLAAVTLLIRHETAALPGLGRLRMRVMRAVGEAAAVMWSAMESLAQIASTLVALVRRRFSRWLAEPGAPARP